MLQHLSREEREKHTTTMAIAWRASRPTSAVFSFDQNGSRSFDDNCSFRYVSTLSSSLTIKKDIDLTRVDNLGICLKPQYIETWGFWGRHDAFYMYGSCLCLLYTVRYFDWITIGSLDSTSNILSIFHISPKLMPEAFDTFGRSGERVAFILAARCSTTRVPARGTHTDGWGL